MKKFIAVLISIFILISTSVCQQPKESESDSARIVRFIQFAEQSFRKSKLADYIDSIDFYLKEAHVLNEHSRFPDLQKRINFLKAKLFSIQHPDEEPNLDFIPAVDSCRKSGNKVCEAKGWSEMGDQIGNEVSSMPLKLFCFKKAIQMFRQSDDSVNEMTTLRYIADVHLQQRRFDLAESELFQILKRDLKGAGSQNVMCSNDLLAALYITKGDYDKALFYALRAEKMMRTSQDSLYAATFYIRISNIYRTIGKNDLCIEWYRKALDQLIRINAADAAFGTIRHIVQLFLDQGKAPEALTFILDQTAKHKPVSANDQRQIQAALGAVYSALKSYELAEKSYLEMIRLQDEPIDNLSNLDRAKDYLSVGNFFIRRSMYDRARPYLLTALVRYEQELSPDILKNIHLSLFKVDSALGNYLSAIKHLRLNNLFRDSIFNIAKNNQIEELQISYETEKKDQLISFKEQQLQQGTILRNIGIAVVALLIIIMALLYNRYRLKQKTNKKLESQQQEITKQNKSLQQLVNDKDWLVKEIHHRVKNNLQMVVSLLNAQTEFLTHPSAIDAIKESRERMQAIAIIHQKLYQLDNSTQINMRSYINELIDNIKDSFADGERIHFKTDVADVSLDISQSVPLGLILNEAITNAVKYAYPKNEKGMIRVSLRHSNTDELQLKVADDGKGLPADVDIEHSNTLGMQLIRLFAEQLEGDLYFINNNGLEITLNFKSAGYHDAAINKIIA